MAETLGSMSTEYFSSFFVGENKLFIASIFIFVVSPCGKLSNIRLARPFAKRI
jgi:hypothetical protein